MTNVGTGYVEIKPDWSAFDGTFSREASARLKAAFDGAGAKVSEELDRGLGEKKIHVDVDVDRHRLAAIGAGAGREIASGLSAASGTVASALEGVTGRVSGALGQIPVLGTAFSSLGEAGAVAAPAIAALALAIGGLVASFGAAVAGAGALGIALAGALGPVALVGVAVIARLTAIFKAMHTDSTASAASLQAVAAAQDQVNTASASLATAQDTLRTQTTAAYAAWADAIENVHDDLLSVKDAEQGIRDARLSTREAQQALKDFEKQAGDAGNAFDQVFKKFSDVNVDTSGLKKALLGAADASGVSLSDDQELKLERLVNNVRDAKLREAHATDTLKDSTRKLTTDQQTAARFRAQELRAYPGYVAAVAGLASAQRGLATAQRNSASAAVKQQGELAKLSPIEQQLARTFKIIGDEIDTAFGPATSAVFTGLNRGLRVFSGVLTDPKIIAALTHIGTAIGGVLVTVARTFSTPKMRDAFVTLADGGAKLVTILGSKVFVDFATIMTQIATAALPALLPLVEDVANILDRWAKWIDKHPKEFKKKIESLIQTFKDWAGTLTNVIGLVYRIGAALRPIGDAMIHAFARPSAALSDLSHSLGLTKSELDKAGNAFRIVGHAISVTFAEAVKVAARNIKNTVATIVRVFTDVVDAIDAIAHGKWSDAWHAIRKIPVDLIHGAITALRNTGKTFAEVGGILGKAFSGGLQGALHNVTSLAKSVLNGVIEIINTGIRDINKVLGPRDLGPLGHTPDLRIATIGLLGTGTKHANKAGGDPRGVFATTSSLRTFGPVPALAGANIANQSSTGRDKPAQVIEKIEIHVPPNEKFLVERLIRELNSRWRSKAGYNLID